MIDLDLSEQAGVMLDQETGTADSSLPAPRSLPTPVQARVLRLLAKWPGASLQRTRTGCDIEPPDVKDGGRQWRDLYHDFYADIRALETGLVNKVRTPTVLAMERAGWVVRRQEQWMNAWPKFDLTDRGRDLVLMLNAEQFLDPPRRPKIPVVSVALMLDAIESRWNREDGWVWFREWQPGLQFRPIRRLDAAAINRWATHGYERMAFEVKRSRGDFLGELAHPEKRQAALAFSNRYWFVAPEGMIQPDEVPAEAGLVWVGEDGAVHIKVKAPKREAEPLGEGLFGAVLRSLADQIAKQVELNCKPAGHESEDEP